MQCPRCGGESKSTGKKWRYSVFDVEGMVCKKCYKKFRVYYRHEKMSHTIPRSI